jgi:hypothetical protein
VDAAFLIGAMTPNEEVGPIQTDFLSVEAIVQITYPLPNIKGVQITVADCGISWLALKAA